MDDFREEGEAISRSITKELLAIHSRNELLAAAPRLKVLYGRLVDVMIRSRTFQANQVVGSEALVSLSHDSQVSDALRTELNRIYRIEGAFEIMEKCQEDALHRLDVFEKGFNQ